MFIITTNQKWLTVLLFIAVLGVNGLANGLPINGLTTGEVSDMYPNLFTPAGFTFGIWGLIYTALLGFVLAFAFTKKTNLPSEKITLLWAVNAVANMTWIFAWHYLKTASSLAIMAILLLSLIWLISELRKVERPDKLTAYSRAAFELYFGWITVATIANVTALLVRYDIDSLVLSTEHWTATIIAVSALIAAWVYIRGASVWYLLPILWAYYGIYTKHESEWGFRGAYPLVMTTLKWTFSALLLVVIARLLLQIRYKRNNSYQKN